MNKQDRSNVHYVKSIDHLDIINFCSLSSIQNNSIEPCSLPVGSQTNKIKVAYAIRDNPPMLDTVPRVVGVASLSCPHTPHIRPRAISTTINSRIHVSPTPAIQLKHKVFLLKRFSNLGVTILDTHSPQDRSLHIVSNLENNKLNFIYHNFVNIYKDCSHNES